MNIQKIMSVTVFVLVLASVIVVRIFPELFAYTIRFRNMGLAVIVGLLLSYLIYPSTCRECKKTKWKPKKGTWKQSIWEGFLLTGICESCKDKEVFVDVEE